MFAVRHGDVHDPGVLRLAVVRRERRRVEQRLGVRLFTAAERQDDVRARVIACVQPEIVASRELERELVVLRGALAHQDRLLVLRDEAAKRFGGLFARALGGRADAGLAR